MGTIFVVLSAKLACHHRLCAMDSTCESSKEKHVGTAWLLHPHRVYGGTANNQEP